MICLSLRCPCFGLFELDHEYIGWSTLGYISAPLPCWYLSHAQIMARQPRVAHTPVLSSKVTRRHIESFLLANLAPPLPSPPCVPEAIPLLTIPIFLAGGGRNLSQTVQGRLHHRGVLPASFCLQLVLPEVRRHDLLHHHPEPLVLHRLLHRGEHRRNHVFYFFRL